MRHDVSHSSQPILVKHSNPVEAVGVWGGQRHQGMLRKLAKSLYL